MVHACAVVVGVSDGTTAIADAMNMKTWNNRTVVERRERHGIVGDGRKQQPPPIEERWIGTTLSKLLQSCVRLLTMV